MTAITESEQMVDRMRVAFAPEAVEFTKMMLDDPIKATQDNYGRVMSFLSRMPEPEMKLAFIAAMADAGYPAATAAAITRAMGLA